MWKTYEDCSDAVWESYLDSKEGIFNVVFRQPPKDITGPTYTDRRTIVGDMWAMEVAIFESSAAPEQIELYNYLESKRDERSNWRGREFLLHVINGLKKWRDDIKHLQGFVLLFKKEEIEFRSEEKNLEYFKRHDVILKNLPSVLRAHFPEDLSRLREDYEHLNVLIRDIELAIRDIHSARDFIGHYLKNTKEHLPFLFY